MNVFLSHNSADKLAVRELKQRLEARENAPESEIDCFLDDADIVAGDPFQSRLEKELYERCDICVAFFGPNGLGRWQSVELDLAYRRFVNDRQRQFRILPVILPGGGPAAENQVPPFLQGFSRVQFRDSLDEPETFRRLHCGILGKPLDDPPLPAGQCPYVGLDPFGRQDAGVFFGRTALVQKLLNGFRRDFGTRRERRFLALIGPSGSGKSSLAAAGLIPAILDRGELRDGNQWLFVHCRPGADPWDNLKTALVANGELARHLSALQSLDAAEAPLEASRKESRLLDRLARVAFHDKPPTHRLLVFVDQFEEFFTQYNEKDSALAKTRETFLENLLHPLASEESRVIVVITLRADFYGRCAEHAGLRDAVSQNHELVGSMGPEELREAIQRPALRAGCEIAPAVVELLLNEMKRQPGALPFLQHALQQMWNRREGRRITLEAYRAIGGFEKALEDFADNAYAQCGSEDQPLCRRILLCLIQSGEGIEDVKRRARVEELTALGDPSRVRFLIRMLSAKGTRLLVTEGNVEKSTDASVELVHEALIRHWPLLRGWLEAEREFRLWRGRLQSGLADFARDHDCVLRGTARVVANDWLQTRREDLRLDEREFIERSEASHRLEIAGRERLRRRIVAGLSAALCLILAAAVIAVLKAFEAREQQDIAFVRQLAAKAELIRSAPHGDLQADGDPQAAALWAAESMARQPSLEADQTLRAALGLLPRCVVTMHHETEVKAVAYNSNGTLLATAAGNAAWLWDARTGSNIATLRHSAPVKAVVFDPHDRYVATASDDKTVGIWRAITGEPVSHVPRSGEVSAIDFAPDGRALATLEGDEMTMFDVETRHEMFRKKVQATAVKFISDGTHLVTGGKDGLVRLWSVTNGEEAAVPTLKLGEGPLHVSLSRDRQHVAGSDGKTVCIGRTGDSNDVVNLTDSDSFVRAVALDWEARRIATGDDDSFAQVLDAESLSPITRMAHQGGVNAVTFSPDQRHLATASDDGTARIWELTGYLEAAKVPAGNPLFDIAFSSDGESFAVGATNGQVRAWETATGKELPELSRASGQNSRTTSYLATVDNNHITTFQDLNGQQKAFPPPGEVRAVTFADDGRHAALAYENRDVVVLEMPYGREISRTQYAKSVSAIALSGRPLRLATGSFDRTARVRDLSSGQERRFDCAGVVNAVCFSRDSRLLAIGSQSTLTIIDLGSDGKPTVLSNTATVVAMAFSPDGKYLAAGGTDFAVSVWNWAEDSELTRLNHPGTARTIRFSPDGRYIATLSEDQFGRLWLWQPKDLIDETGKRVTRNLTPHEWAGLRSKQPYQRRFPRLP